MADKEHLHILEKGADAWNAWREEEFYTRPQLRDTDFQKIDAKQFTLWDADLSGSNFSGKDLSGQDLMDIDATGAKFNGATLRKTRFVSANFYLADLVEADLRGADLQAVDFRYANLSNADLRETYLGGANFTGANLNKTRFDNSLFNGTTFGDNDLSTVTGLESGNHNGPSIIGIDTLYRSDGHIPPAFLRGCGVLNEFVDAIPLLIESQRSAMFDSCFISYSHKDEEFGKYLVSKMRNAKIRVWFPQEDIVGGRKIVEQIKQKIETHNRLLVVLSHDSLNSEWVKTEIGIAAKIEKLQGRKKLFPIRLIDMDAIDTWSCFDTDMGKDLAKEIREYPIPNFATWNQDSNVFETEFEKLVQALRKESDKERNK